MCFQFMPPFASVCLVSFCLMPPFASVCLVSLWFEIRNISGSSPCLGLDHLSRSLCQLVLGLDWQSAHLSGSISWWQIATNISEVPCLVRCQQLLSCIFNKMFDMVKVIHETEGWFYCNLGIPNGCRARSILFLRCSIQPKTKAYPAIGQKNWMVLPLDSWWTSLQRYQWKFNNLIPLMFTSDLDCQFFMVVYGHRCNVVFQFTHVSQQVDCWMCSCFCKHERYLCFQPSWPFALWWC